MGKSANGSISKLSKRHGATNFNDLIQQGYLPEAITNYIVLLGWNPKNTNQEIFSMNELINLFNLNNLSKSPAIFDYNKLNWVNSEYIKNMSTIDFINNAKPFIDLNNIFINLPEDMSNNDSINNSNNTLDDKVTFLVNLLKPRISKFTDITNQIQFLINPPIFNPELFANKRNKITPELSIEVLSKAINVLPNTTWTTFNLINAISMIDPNLKINQVTQPIRIALSMQKITPGNATDILYLLGKTTSLKRLNDTLSNLKNI